jgi:hypothetical protein
MRRDASRSRTVIRAGRAAYDRTRATAKLFGRRLETTKPRRDDDMTKTTKSPKTADKFAKVGKPSGVVLTEAQLDKAAGGMLACRTTDQKG